MFATLRAEDRDGEVICISSTTQLPQAGQSQNHFACDRCRVKKLKCSGHRFGCQRCRDRNISCTYSTTSQSRQRKAERLSKAQKSTSQNVSPPSGAEEFFLLQNSPPGDTARRSPAHQTPRQSALGGAKNGHPFILTPEAMDGEPQVSSPSAHLARDTGPASSIRQTEQASMKSSGFHNLEIPDFMESSLPDFDIDELLQADMSPSGIECNTFALESTLPSSTSPEDTAGSHDGTYDLSRSNTLSGEQIFLSREADSNPTLRDAMMLWGKEGFSANTATDDMEWISYPHKRRPEPAGEQMRTEPARMPLSKTSSQDRTSTAASSPQPATMGGNSEISTLVNIRQTRPSPASRTGIRPKNPSPCRCVGVTLSLLERIQGHRKPTSIFVAERALHLLKGSISQCQALASCRSCPSPSRLMAFSVLLVEKMAWMLEDMASMWEEVTMAPGAEAGTEVDATRLDADGRACGWVPLHLGQYRIDSAQEWHEVFGLLVLLQLRRLSSFLDRLRSNSGREGLESHRSALGSVSLRVRELQETLGGMTTGLDR